MELFSIKIRCTFQLVSTSKDDNPRNKMDIRIELYSFEDIYELASNRNNVFFKLLKKEFDIE